MITIEIQGNNVALKYEDTGSSRFREWLVPICVMEDLKRWYNNKINLNKTQKTKICRYEIHDTYIDIKRIDIYNLIHFVLPIKVIEYYIRNSKNV